MTMITHAPATYTAYAKTTCPSWCTQPHDAYIDGADRSVVVHECDLPSIDIGSDIDPGCGREQITATVQHWRDLNGEDNGPAVLVQGCVDNRFLRPEDAVKVALLYMEAAEVARTP